MESKKYFKTLQILRALAFLGIFFFHTTLLPDVFSRWSITVFLMLSGFLNAVHGYGQEIDCSPRASWKNAVRKIRRIYPLHLVMLIIAFGLYAYSVKDAVINSLGERLPIALGKLVSNAFLISDGGPKSGWWYNIFSEYNIVTWYLSLSLLLFLLTPLFLQIMHKLYGSEKAMTSIVTRAILISLLIYAITIVINIMFVNHYKDSSMLYIYESPLSRIGDYLIAMQAGYIYGEKRHLPEHQNTTLSIAIAATASILSIVLIYAGDLKNGTLPASYSWIMNSGFYFTVPTVILIYHLATLENASTYKLNYNKTLNIITKPFLILAALSQYAFLIHVPVISLIHGILRRIGDVNIWLWSLISFVLTMLFSVVVDRCKKR